MHRSTLAVLGIALAPLVAAAQQTGRDDASFLWSKQLSAGTLLTIKSGNGPIEVRESTNDRVEVRAVKRPTRRTSIRDVSFDVREPSGANGEAMICVVYDGVSMCDDNRSHRDRKS